jgi:hypothetical protein
MKAILTGALLTLTIITAGAEEDTTSARFMLPYCKMTTQQLLVASPVDAYFNGDCFGIVLGVRRTLGMVRAAEKDGDGKLGPYLCADIPPNVTLKQMVNVVIRYAEMHSADTHEDFGYFAIFAVHEAWPCRPQRPRP